MKLLIDGTVYETGEVDTLVETAVAVFELEPFQVTALCEESHLFIAPQTEGRTYTEITLTGDEVAQATPATQTAEGQMVFCVECKHVVWAFKYDYGHVAGLMNMMRHECPRRSEGCTGVGTFDQYPINSRTIERYKAPDAWAAMHAIADEEGLVWDSSPNNIWFWKEVSV